MFPESVILTLDLGTTMTKAALWSDDGFVAVGRAPLTTTHPAPDRAEQDPATWWSSVADACAAARAAAPRAFAAVGALGFSAARQTLVAATAAGDPIGPGLLWSDRRAVAEAGDLAVAAGGSEAVRRHTGIPLNGGSVAAKAAWLWAHEPERAAAARWLLSPRDLVAWRLTGELATDPTLASATGLYDPSGTPMVALAGEWSDRLPPAIPSTSVLGRVRPAAAAELGLRTGLPVVIGAGDRQCEAIGAGASPERPVVSWGTTANVSMPMDDWPDPLPAGIAVTRSATGGWLLEGGLSAAGTLLSWLATLTATGGDELLRQAAGRPPGARGVVAVPWLGGARAPWWRDGTG
ncbi:MAG TPA: FGGY family carbohydrate kinase, partial [Acidimicrobiales bacterium]